MIGLLKNTAPFVLCRFFRANNWHLSWASPFGDWRLVKLRFHTASILYDFNAMGEDCYVSTRGVIHIYTKIGNLKERRPPFAVTTGKYLVGPSLVWLSLHT